MKSDPQPEVTATATVPVPVPRLLAYADIPTAVDISIDAFKGSPFHRYLHETPDSVDNVLTRAARRAQFATAYASFVRKSTGWTLDDGAAIVGYTRAEESNTGWSLDKFLDWAVSFVFAYKKVLLSEEQTKRAQEVRGKTRKAVEETLGARKGSMIYLSAAVTSPAKQGRGYGSTLVKIVTDKADEEKRSTWLMSGDAANESFYKSLGFKVCAEILLGDDNPTWTEPPVLLTLMIREYGDDSLNDATR